MIARTGRALGYVLAAAALTYMLSGFSPAGAFDINRTGLSGEAIEGFDPVAYWLDGKPARGKGLYSFEWQGAIWRFASAEHLDLFKSDPEKFAPQFGGYCAYGIGRGLKADIHPYFWEVHDGRLYLFVSSEAKTRWLADRAKLEEAGARQWAVLSRRFY